MLGVKNLNKFSWNSWVNMNMEIFCDISFVMSKYRGNMVMMAFMIITDLYGI